MTPSITELQKLLRGMGRSPRAVADFLLKSGCYGVRLREQSCPLAEYLTPRVHEAFQRGFKKKVKSGTKWCSPEFERAVNKVAALDKPPVYVDEDCFHVRGFKIRLTAAQRAFVAAFDSGEFPELELNYDPRAFEDLGDP